MGCLPLGLENRSPASPSGTCRSKGSGWLAIEQLPRQFEGVELLDWGPTIAQRDLETRHV